MPPRGQIRSKAVCALRRVFLILLILAVVALGVYVAVSYSASPYGSFMDYVKHELVKAFPSSFTDKLQDAADSVKDKAGSVTDKVNDLSDKVNGVTETIGGIADDVVNVTETVQSLLGGAGSNSPAGSSGSASSSGAGSGSGGSSASSAPAHAAVSATFVKIMSKLEDSGLEDRTVAVLPEGNREIEEDLLARGKIGYFAIADGSPGETEYFDPATIAVNMLTVVLLDGTPAESRTPADTRTLFYYTAGDGAAAEQLCMGLAEAYPAYLFTVTRSEGKTRALCADEESGVYFLISRVGEHVLVYYDGQYRAPGYASVREVVPRVISSFGY